MPTNVTSPAGPPKWEDFEDIGQQTPVEAPKWDDFQDAPGGQSQIQAPTWDEFEAPAGEPPKAEEKPSPWAFPASPYRQAPLPLPSEIPPPAPEQPKAAGDRMAEVMQQWGEKGRWRFPTPEDVTASKDIAVQAYRGGQQAPFQLSASMQNLGAWTSELMAKIAESEPMPGAWAPSLTPEERKASAEHWRKLSKHFSETAKIPQAYVDAIETIAKEEPGPEKVRQVLASSGSIVPSLAVAPIGFPAMIAMAGLQQAGDSFQEGIEKRMEKGEDEATARQNAVTDGAISGVATAIWTAAFGKTGVDSIAKAAAEKATKGALVYILKEAGWEAAEETVDQLTQVIISKMRHDDMSLWEATKWAITHPDELVVAGAAGFFLGGGVASVTQVSEASNEAAARSKEYKEIAEAARQAIETASQPGVGPVRGTTRPMLPVLPGTEGAGAVRQALSLGMPRTAETLADLMRKPVPLDVSIGREFLGGAPAAAAAPAPSVQETAAPVPPGPTQPTGPAAASVTPAAEAVSGAEPAVRPTPTAEAGIAPTTIPQAAGVSPAPEPAPAAPAPAIESEQSLGLRTVLERDHPRLQGRYDIVENGEAFPESVKAELSRRGLALDDADAVFHNGRVIFNAKKFPTGDPDLVNRKVTHEAAIHLGLRQALGNERFNALTQSVWRTLRPQDRARIALRNRLDFRQEQAIGEEWLAYEAERIIQMGHTDNAWTRIATAIRSALRRLGLRYKYNDLEIARMISKGFEAITQTAPSQSTAETRLSATPQYGPGHSLAQIDTIRFSIADVQRAKLEGVREYAPEIINAGMEGAFEGVKKILYIEAESLSDLIPPTTPWHQPQQGQSLIEYVRQFYSPEGIALIRQTLSGDRPPGFVTDKDQWYRIKAELANVQDPRNIGQAAAFLAQNRKAGGLSWDFGLGTCLPTTNCAVCYATAMQNPLMGTQARLRHALVTAMEPEIVGTMIARYVSAKDKGDFPFLRINGAGDTTFSWQATAVNTLIQNMDRPVHIFSRSHVSRAPGTIGLGDISNGHYDVNDIENGVAVYKMGSIDKQLMDEYGIPFLRENLEKRGIINSYLVQDVDDIPRLLALKKAGVFFVMHINKTQAIVKALQDANLIATSDNPELVAPACYCALESGPFLNGCATCLVGGGPCFALGSQLGMTPDGQIVNLTKLLDGEVEPPQNRVVEFARIGLPKNRQKLLLDVAATSYEMAATKLKGQINSYNTDKAQQVVVENPRDRTAILILDTDEDVEVLGEQIVKDFRAHAKYLRGLYQKFIDAPAFFRYVAQAEMEKAISLEQAMTEGLGAAARAVEGAGIRLSVSGATPPGVVRIYRGEETTGGASGQWWTTNPSKAASFAAGGRVYAVDVPQVALEIGKEEARRRGQGGDTAFFPRELNRLAKPVDVPTPVHQLDAEAQNMFLSVTPGEPSRTPAEVAAMPITDFADWARTLDGGITGEAVRVGLASTTPEQIAELEQLRDQSKGESSALMKAGDFDNAMAAATRGQYFREAYETATNTGSMATALKNGRVARNVKPIVQPDTPLQSVASEGLPPGQGVIDDLVKPNPDTVVKEHDDDYTIRYSISQMPDPYTPGAALKNESMERALREAGFTGGLPEAMGKPDRELMRAVQEKMARFPHWVDTILEREEKKPGLLTDEEVMALDYWMLQLRTEVHSYSRQAEEAERAGRISEAAMHRGAVDFWLKALIRLSEITKRSGTESARAFRARQLATKWDFTLEALITKKRSAQGWKDLTEAEYKTMVADLEKKAREYQDKTAKLEAEVARLRREGVTEAMDDAREEVKRINPQVLEFAQEWVDRYRTKRKSAADRLKVKWARAFPDQPLRASVSPGAAPALPDELMRELAIIGGAYLAENVTETQAWEKAMLDELGPNVGPYLAAARQAAEAHLAQELANARTELKARRAPRKTPGAPAVAKPEVTLEDQMALTRARIHQVAELMKQSAEAVRARSDDIFYPTQQLVRELIEQDPYITREELIAEVHKVLVQEFDNWTEDETMDAISGRGRVRRPDPEIVAVTMRDLKAQVRILSHIRDTKARKALPRTGYQPDKPSDEQRHLLEQLNDVKRRFGEVVTDPEAQLATYLQSRKTWYRNRLADLLYEIENETLIVRRSANRQEETDPELEALKQEYARVKERHDAIFQNEELTDEERLEMAEKDAERMIAKLEADLAAGRKTYKGQRDRLTSAKLEALRTRIIQLKAEQEWAQMAINPPPDLQNPADIKRWFQLQRQITKIEQQLATQQPFSPSKPIREEKASNVKLQERLEELKRQRQEMREQLRPTKVDPVTRAINSRIAQLNRQVADWSARLANRDFEPRKRKEPIPEVAENSEVVRLLAERERIKKEFASELENDRWKNASTVKKIWIGIRRTRTAITNLRSSFDLSAPRQGLIALLSLSSRAPSKPIQIPLKIIKAFRQMIEAALSTKRADRINELIKQLPNWQSGAYKLMDIQFTDIEAPQFNVWEENARSVFDEWAKMPIFHAKWHAPITTPLRLIARPVAASNRAFATFLNVLRANLADELLDTNFKDRPATLNELRVLGNYVNVATGRGYVNARAAQGFSELLWAPKLLMSRIQFLTGQPLWGGGTMVNSARARKIIAKEYARVLGSAFLLYMVSRMFDEKKERDPTSSDFGKIVRGNTRIDIWGGFAQMVVLMSRLMAGRTKSLRGRQIDLLAQNKFNQGGLGMVLWRFFRSKLRPDVAVALDLASRRDYLGNPITAPGVLEDLFIPLPFADMWPILKDRGFTEGMILEMMNQFGAGVNTYEDAKPQNYLGRETRTR